MHLYFFLAIILGIMLRWLATVGIRSCVQKSATDEQLKEMTGFHISCVSYILGTILKYTGATLLFAYFIKTYLLT